SCFSIKRKVWRTVDHLVDVVPLLRVVHVDGRHSSKVPISQRGPSSPAHAEGLSGPPSVKTAATRKKRPVLRRTTPWPAAPFSLRLLAPPPRSPCRCGEHAQALPHPKVSVATPAPHLGKRAIGPPACYAALCRKRPRPW